MSTPVAVTVGNLHRFAPEGGEIVEIYSDGSHAGGKIALSNGTIVSVAFGTGNYCSNRHRSRVLPATTVEVLAWKADETDIVTPYSGADGIHAYIPPSELTEIIAWLDANG